MSDITMVLSDGNYYFYETLTKKYWPVALWSKHYTYDQALDYMKFLKS